jgi:hypothetical protein
MPKKEQSFAQHWKNKGTHSPHTNGNRQYHCHRIQQRYNKTKTHKSNGYALLLDKRQSETRPIQCVLGPGYQNLADYFTKHHSPAHHKRMREIYIHADEHPINQKGIQNSTLRGYVNTSGKAGAQIPHLPLGDDSSPRGR